FMEQLQQARNLAIGLGASITDNDVGFISCFDSNVMASNYANEVNDTWDDITAEAQGNCAVVVTIASLM
ncbi:MAG: hypothetical protein F6K16_38475, partial [Symploca sp. SIO2B6]|nr:hypothetical protein [Symploca sp. SIO2B6]